MSELMWSVEIAPTERCDSKQGFIVHIDTTIGPFRTYDDAQRAAQSFEKKLPKRAS